MERTPRQRLADVLLGRPLEEWVAERRAAKQSWRAVARELEEATGGAVAVTEVTLRAWMANATAAA